MELYVKLSRGNYEKVMNTLTDNKISDFKTATDPMEFVVDNLVEKYSTYVQFKPLFRSGEIDRIEEAISSAVSINSDDVFLALSDLQDKVEEELKEPYNEEEVKEKFLNEVHDCVDYWEDHGTNTRDKLEGLAYSILNMIDGEHSNIPKFILAPDPYPEDRQYHMENHQRFYPENYNNNINCDISGGLHDLFYKVGRKREEY